MINFTQATTGFINNGTPSEWVLNTIKNVFNKEKKLTQERQ